MDEDKIDRVVDQVVGDLAGQGMYKMLQLTNGGVLKLKAPPTMAVQMLHQRHQMPEPPMAKVESDGRTWEEPNPSHPDYQKAVEAYNLETGEALIRLMLWSSTEIVQLPVGVKPYEEDDEWVEELSELLGVEVPTTARLRKITWMRYRILGSPKDHDAFQRAMSELSGFSEEEIKKAEANFRG